MRSLSGNVPQYFISQATLCRYARFRPFPSIERNLNGMDRIAKPRLAECDGFSSLGNGTADVPIPRRSQIYFQVQASKNPVDVILLSKSHVPYLRTPQTLGLCAW